MPSNIDDLVAPAQHPARASSQSIQPEHPPSCQNPVKNPVKESLPGGNPDVGPSRHNPITTFEEIQTATTPMGDAISQSNEIVKQRKRSETSNPPRILSKNPGTELTRVTELNPLRAPPISVPTGPTPTPIKTRWNRLDQTSESIGSSVENGARPISNKVLFSKTGKCRSNHGLSPPHGAIRVCRGDGDGGGERHSMAASIDPIHFMERPNCPS